MTISASRRPELDRWLLGYSVLLSVTDTTEFQFLASWVTERGGVAIRVADGRDVKKSLSSHNHNRLLFMLEVPMGDGFSTVRQACLEARAAAALASIVLLTRSVADEARYAALREISDAVLAVPVLKSAFEEAILQLTQRTEEGWRPEEGGGRLPRGA